MRESAFAGRIGAVSLFCWLAAAAGAQPARPGVVQVTVRDSSGAPVAAAELTLTRGLRDVIARGRTDDSGTGVLAFQVSDSTELQVTARKIGYGRTDRFFEGAPSARDTVSIVVARPAAALSAVRVTAQAEGTRASYHLDADDIEAATMPLLNGWETIKLLRPDMLTSRGGCATGVQQVWVNGSWIRLPLPLTGVAASRVRAGAPPSARYSSTAANVLSEIAPEHIQEIRYHDCFDTSAPQVGGVNAMFVVLKPGVIYDENVGSYVSVGADKPGDGRR